MPTALRLDGPFGPRRSPRACARSLRRHESLRTRFDEREGARPGRSSCAAPASTVPLVDLAGLPGRPAAGAAAAAPARRRAGPSTSPADRCCAPPWCASPAPLALLALVPRSSAGRSTLLVTLHHIVSDGWSMGVLVRELAALYGAFAAGRPSPLPELAVQYADYAVWQRALAAGRGAGGELACWRGSSAGAPAVRAADRPAAAGRAAASAAAARPAALPAA